MIVDARNADERDPGWVRLRWGRVNHVAQYLRGKRWAPACDFRNYFYSLPIGPQFPCLNGRRATKKSFALRPAVAEALLRAEAEEVCREAADGLVPGTRHRERGERQSSTNRSSCSSGLLHLKLGSSVSAFVFGCWDIARLPLGRQLELFHVRCSRRLSAELECVCIEGYAGPFPCSKNSPSAAHPRRDGRGITRGGAGVARRSRSTIRLPSKAHLCTIGGPGGCGREDSRRCSSASASTGTPLSITISHHPHTMSITTSHHPHTMSVTISNHPRPMSITISRHPHTFSMLEDSPSAVVHRPYQARR